MKRLKSVLILCLSSTSSLASASNYECTIMRQAEFSQPKESAMVRIEGIEGHQAIAQSGRLDDGTYYTLQASDLALTGASPLYKDQLSFTVWFSQTVVQPGSADHDQIVSGTLQKGAKVASFAGSSVPIYMDLTCRKVR